MKNVYFLFSVKDKYFTELSHLLKTNEVYDNYYGLAYAKNSILKDPIYTHISYISDILKNTNQGVDYEFLRDIERKYKINVAELIQIDRHILRQAKTRRLFVAQELLRIFILELTKFNISTVFVEGIDDFISFFACIYCKHHNIRFLFSTYIGYDSRSCFSSNIYAGPDNFEKKFRETLWSIKENKLNIKTIEAKLNSYIENKNKPSYSKADDKNYKIIELADFKTFFQYFLAFMHDRNGMHYDRFPLLIPFYRLIRIYRNYRYQRILTENKFDFKLCDNLNYLIFPLQLEPESSILIQGRWLNDQLKIIEIISKNLPANTILLVKEHKVSIGRRKPHFYKEIIKHHNVYLIDHKIDNFELIKQSKGVVIISSTMGLEALLLKKPVMAFGERYFNVSKNVFVVSNYKEINTLILNMLSHCFDELDAIAVFQTLFDLTIEDLGCHIHFGYTLQDLQKMVRNIQMEISNQYIEPAEDVCDNAAF